MMRRALNALTLTAATLTLLAGPACVVVDEGVGEEWADGSAWCDEDGCWYCDAWGCYAYGCAGDEDCPSECSCFDGQCFGDEFSAPVADEGLGARPGRDGDGVEGRPRRPRGADPEESAPPVSASPAEPEVDVSTTEGSGEIPCRASCECPDGQVCDLNVCRAPELEVSGEEPEPTACDSDCDCPAGDRCVDAFCRVACREPSDCAAGLACVDGACVDGAGLSPTPPAQEDRCLFDRECPGGLCLDGACHARCDEDGGCPSGEACLGGRVCDKDSDRASECVYSDVCGGGMGVCLDGACKVACEDDAPCARGELCERGLCQPDRLPGPQCLRTDDCHDGQACVDAACREVCRADVDCGDDAGCERGFCIPAVEREPECGGDLTCGDGARCLNATCVVL